MMTSEPLRVLIRGELAANIRAERARKGLDQASVVNGMRDLGFSEWRRQTVSRVERGERRVLAEEICALTIVLGTSVAALMPAALQAA